MPKNGHVRNKEVPERLYGLSSAEALQRLHDELTAEIRLYEGKTKFSSFSQRFASTFLHHNRVESVFHWTSFAAIAVQVILLIIAYSNQPYRDTWLIVEAIFLFILLVINIYLLAYDDNLRKKEHVVKAKKVLKSIRNCIKEQRPIWNPSNYINLHAPLSPCVSLQWTVRDGELVNLPCGLLVAGDVIYMRPGQIVPCRCKSFQPEAVIIDDQVLEANDVYNPSSSEFNRSGPGPTLKRPYRPQPYIVLQTPFLNNIRSILEEAQHRPSSLLNNERFYITSVILERKIMPLVFAIFLLVNLVRYLCLPDDVGHWTEMGIVLQVHAILPFLPLVSPLLWRLLDIYGMAKVLAMFNKCLKQMPLKENVLESDAYLTGEMTLGSKHTEKNPDFDGETIFAKEALGSSPLEETIRHFRDVLYGYSDCLPRTSNIVHVLGNTTSFCCVDKKGILSWPNPTAEKVFFLRGADPDDSLSTGQNDTDSGNEEPPNEGCRDAKRKGVQGDVHFEVLDLTQDPKSGYKLNFDDPNWKKHLSSLKPMGLNILLDTCNIETVERYTEFADHVTSASLLRESAVPVVNRRSKNSNTDDPRIESRSCFCELSRQIGFSDPAMDIFELQEMLGLYRHLRKELSELKTFTRDPYFQLGFSRMPRVLVLKENISITRVQVLEDVIFTTK